MGQKEKLLTIIFFILGFLSIIRTIHLLWNNFLPDFSVLYDSSIILFSGQNPYINKNLYTQVNYPPIALYFIFPFLIFPFSIASNIWLILSTLSFLISSYLLYKVRPVSLFVVSIIFIASVFSFPFKFTFGMGQVNLMLLLLLCFSLFLFVKNKRFLAIFFIALASALKLFPIFLSLILFFKKPSLFIAFSILLFFLFLIPFFTTYFSTNIYYFKNILLPLIFSSSGNVYYNQSITGLFSRLNISQFLLFARLFIILTSFVMLYRKKENLFFAFSLLLTSILLINNFSWQHHLILLLIPFYFLTSQLKNKKHIFILIISYLLISFNIENPDYFTHLWYGSFILSHGFLGIFILWLLLIFYNNENYEK